MGVWLITSFPFSHPISLSLSFIIIVTNVIITASLYTSKVSRISQIKYKYYARPLVEEFKALWLELSELSVEWAYGSCLHSFNSELPIFKSHSPTLEWNWIRDPVLPSLLQVCWDTWLSFLLYPHPIMSVTSCPTPIPLSQSLEWLIGERMQCPWRTEAIQWIDKSE